jgi:AraC family transcriptional activator of tynA and feaB
VTTWSTDGVRTGERFSFWREVVCQTVLNVATEAPRERFHARISGRSLGALRFAAFESTSHEIVRSRQHAARFPEDHYLVSLQRRGRSLIEQDDVAFALDPGEIALVDGQKPFRIGFPAAVSRVLAVIPRATIELRAPWLRRRAARRLAASSPYADLARRHLLALADDERDLTESEAGLLSENLCNLLALTSAGNTPIDALRPDTQLAAVIAFCRRNLSDPELSPRLAAAQLGLRRGTARSAPARRGHLRDRLPYGLQRPLALQQGVPRPPRHDAARLAQLSRYFLLAVSAQPVSLMSKMMPFGSLNLRSKPSSPSLPRSKKNSPPAASTAA